MKMFEENINVKKEKRKREKADGFKKRVSHI